jgi:RNA polymerase sigma factor (TIGR02999 family)
MASELAEKTWWVKRFDVDRGQGFRNPQQAVGRSRPAGSLHPHGALVGMSEVTHILSAIEQGDPHAAEQLLPLVYAELRKLAAQRLAQEKPGQTLQATALVHDAYLRLVDTEKARQWNSRGHFFAAAAEAMRQILVQNARHRSRRKHGGGRSRIDMDDLEIAAPERSEELLALDEALGQLAAVDPQAAELVKLRYFAGCTVPEAAAVLGVSPRSADFLWVYARTWLFQKIQGGETAPTTPPSDKPSKA